MYSFCILQSSASRLRKLYFRAMTIESMNQSEGLSELQSVQMKANSVVDESLDSTRRMIAMCEEVSHVWLVVRFFATQDWLTCKLTILGYS